MDTSILKCINKFFTFFEKDHIFYINGNQIKVCKATNTSIEWGMDDNWDFLAKREINAVIVKGTSLTITAMNGKKYTFTAKPKSKGEIMEAIILSIKNRLILTFYGSDNKEMMAYSLLKEAIDEIKDGLDELKRINKK